MTTHQGMKCKLCIMVGFRLERLFLHSETIVSDYVKLKHFSLGKKGKAQIVTIENICKYCHTIFYQNLKTISDKKEKYQHHQKYQHRKHDINNSQKSKKK